MDPRHALGMVGEQSSGFYFGRLGYRAILGPSGSSKNAHGVTTSGPDGVFYNPETDHLILADNKATSKSAKKVYSATAIDKNWNKSVNKTLNQIKNIKGIPAKIQSRVTQLLEQCRDNPTNPPANVSRVVQNAHGSGIKGIAGRLAGSQVGGMKVVFIPFSKTFSSGRDCANFCKQQQAAPAQGAGQTTSASAGQAGGVSQLPRNAATKPTSPATAKLARSLAGKSVGRSLAGAQSTRAAAAAAATQSLKVTKLFRAGGSPG